MLTSYRLTNGSLFNHVALAIFVISLAALIGQPAVAQQRTKKKDFDPYRKTPINTDVPPQCRIGPANPFPPDWCTKPGGPPPPALSRSNVKQTIQDNRDALKKCAALLKNKTTILVSFKVMARGSTQSIKINGDVDPQSSSSKCVVKVVKHMQFPKIDKEAKPTLIEYPFVLEPPTDQTEKDDRSTNEKVDVAE